MATRKALSRQATAAPTPTPPPALLGRLEALVDSLRPSEQAVARFILQHPNRVISLSFPELAAAAGVSQPTIARFCKAAGFEGYRDFKLQLAKSLAEGVPFVHRDVSLQDSMADVGAKVFDRAIAALVTVRNHLGPQALDRAARLLADARRIEFYGAGNSGIVAMDAQHKFFRLGAPTAAYADAHVHAMSASLLGAGDVVVAISGSGRSIDLLRSVEIAIEAGAHVIAITPSGSPLAQLVEAAPHVALYADVTEDLDVYAPMTSRLVHLAIIDVLCVGVAVLRGPDLATKLQRAKQAVAEKRLQERSTLRRDHS
ncbi:MAG: SIS domain-containing protein [Betaproteobacteria bacterium]|nr:SIS domain-containing protein [Betaproteobacteria bacterium]